MKYLVSACLLGDNCKYNGGNNYSEEIIEFLKDKEYIKICPECMGGLSVPRSPSEIKDGKVINKLGVDVTHEYQTGAEKSLMIAKKEKIKKAILKSNSPSCGVGKIYNGNFEKVLIPGDGITARILKENGIEVISSSVFTKN